MNHYEFYKDLYFRENDRRTELENSLNIPFAIITALVAGIYILATTFPYSSEEGAAKYIFIVLMVGTALTLAGAVFFVILVYGDASGFFHIFNPRNTFSYRGIPYAQSLLNWHENLVVFYTSNPPLPNSAGVVLSALEQADVDLEEYLLNQFVAATNHNTFVNDRKLTDIYRTKKLLIISLIFNFLALFPYMFGFVTKKDEVHKVELQNKVHTVEFQKTAPKNSPKTMSEKKHKPAAVYRPAAAPRPAPVLRPQSVPAPAHNPVRPVSVQNPLTGKYKQVDPRQVQVRTDSTGKPCPPSERIIKEGKYPEKPLDYKN